MNLKSKILIIFLAFGLILLLLDYFYPLFDSILYDIYELLGRSQNKIHHTLATFNTCNDFFQMMRTSFIGRSEVMLSSSDYSDRLNFGRLSYRSQLFSDKSQVSYINEPTTVISDGTYIYLFSKANRKIYIIKAVPLSEIKVVSEISVNEYDGFFLSRYEKLRLYISDNTLAYIVPYYSKRNTFESIYPTTLYTMVKIYNISEKRNPYLLKSYAFQGSYLFSIKRGKDLYLFTVLNPYRVKLLDETFGIFLKNQTFYVPMYIEDNLTYKPLTSCKDIYYQKGSILPREAGLINLIKISLNNPNKKLETISVYGSGSNVLFSTNNVYVIQSFYPNILDVIDEPKDPFYVYKIPSLRFSSIHTFTIENSNNISYGGRVLFDASIDSEASLDETSDSALLSVTNIEKILPLDPENGIYLSFKNGTETTLKKFNITAKQSAMTDAFVYENTIFTIYNRLNYSEIVIYSLVNATEIIQIQDLVVKGSIKHIYPLDNRGLYLLIGKQKDEHYLKDKKLLIYLLSLKNKKPEIVSSYDLQLSNSYFEFTNELDDSLFYSDNHKIFGFPVNLRDPYKITTTIEYDQDYYQGIMLFSIEFDKIHNVMNITHYDISDSETLSELEKVDGAFDIRKAILIGDLMYTVSDKMIKVYNIKTLREVARLRII